MTDTIENTRRQQLLDSAVELAESGGRMQELRKQIGPDQWQDAYENEVEFQRAVLDVLMSRVRADLLPPVEGIDAGNNRVVAGINAYLDAQLRRPLIRQLMQHLKEVDGGTDYIRRRISGFNYLIAAELKSISWPHPEMTARLLAAAIIEAATMEFEAGRKLDDLRQIFADYLHQR